MKSRPFTVLVTRTADQSAGLRQGLQRAGARVIAFPTIEIAPPEDWSPAEDAARRIAEFDWIVFASANAVRFFASLNPNLTCSRIAVVGSATADALRELGIQPTLIPDRFDAAAVADLLAGKIQGKRVLIPRGNRGRDDLVEALRRDGAIVETVTVYRTIHPASDPEPLRQSLRRGEIGYVVFGSPSAAEGLAVMMGEDLRGMLSGVIVVSIGPWTSRYLRDHGAEPVIEAPEASSGSLVQAIREYHAATTAADTSPSREPLPPQ